MVKLRVEGVALVQADEMSVGFESPPQLHFGAFKVDMEVKKPVTGFEPNHCSLLYLLYWLLLFTERYFEKDSDILDKLEMIN